MSDEGLLPYEAKPYQHSSILHDIYDRQAYEEAQTNYVKLAEAAAKREETQLTAAALVQDVFYAFHKPVVQLVAAEEMAFSHQLNRHLVEQMLRTNEFNELHLATIGDELTAAIATVGASEKLLASLDKATARRLNELVQLEQHLESLMSQAATLEELAAETKSAHQTNPETEPEAIIQPTPERLRQRAKELHAQAQKAQISRDKLVRQLSVPKVVEQIENTARQAVRSALVAATEEISQLNQTIKAFSGGYDSGSLTDQTGGINGNGSLIVIEKVKLALKVKANPTLQRLAEVCGRFTRIALSIQKTKTTQPPDEVVGIKTGNDLTHLVSSELALLADPELEILFYTRFAEKKLLIYELDKLEPQGRGPIIVALDSSGSMQTVAANGLSREVWSKGAALALMAIARLQKRDIALLHFSSPSQLRVDIFPKGQATPLAVMESAEHFYGGGTDYAGWMTQALALVDQSAFNRADVIIVSDGEVNIPAASVAEWNKRRKERELRCYAVLIGETQGVAALSQISESVTSLLDLTQDGEALQTIFSI
jgi:uncharacterized protein with von Willebrand factor type A (vWA) domain